MNQPFWHKTLIAALIYSLIFEIAFAAVLFWAPAWAMEQSQVQVTQDTLFLAFGLGTCLVGIGLVCGLSLKQVLERNPAGHVLVDVLGYWWIAVGVVLYFKFGKVDNLFLDSLKGAILVLCNYKSR